MNSKKVNWFFLTTILLHFLIVVLVVVFHYVMKWELGIISNFVISSMIIVVPGACFFAFCGDNWKDALGLHKIKWSTVLMIILFTFLTMPVTTVINAISMLFVDNVVEQLSEEVMKVPFLITFFFIAVEGPLGEELVFRGLVFRGYRKSGNIWKAAILSSLLFALGHMNFNQAAYAFVVGMLLVLLVEATGSIWASVIYHFIFNAQSVCAMYLSEKFLPEGIQEEILEGTAYTEALIYSISIYMLISMVTLAVAGCVLAWIAKNENRTEQLKAVWKTRHEKGERMVTIPLIAAIVISIAYMVLEVIWV